jgi:hypothetical protein
MNNTFLKYIKITLALVLFLQVGKVSAQSFVTWGSVSAGTSLSGTFTGGTASLTQSSTGGNMYFNSPSPSTYPGLTQTGNTTFQRVNAAAYTEVPKDLIITFSTPVKITKLNITGLDAPATYNDQVAFSGVSFSGYTASAFATATSTGVQPLLTKSSQYGNFTNSTTAVSSFTIKAVPRDGLYNAVYAVEMEVVACTTAPTLSATTLTATCPANTVNLNSLVTSTLPTGGTLKWYSDLARTTEVPNPTTLNVSGTFYAFYVDTVNNCFSPASAAVAVTANCPLNVATTCPAVSIDLSTRINTTPATGYTYTYHTGTPATTANKITNPVVTSSGTYYIGTYFAAQDCYANTSRPIVVTITNCCATITAPTVN